MTLEIVNPDGLGRPRGWSHGVLAPAGARILFVAGQTAPDGTGFVEQFDRALELRPFYFNALYQRGNCRQAVGHYEQAIAAYRAARAGQPEPSDAPERSPAAAIGWLSLPLLAWGAGFWLIGAGAATPAAPMAVSTAMATTTTCAVSDSSIPNAWARTSTVIPSKSAVPFMFMVAPSGSTNPATSRGTPNPSSAVRMVVGSVAFELEVLKAVSMSERARRKSSVGRIPASTRATSASVPNWWSMRPSSTTVA